MKTIAIIPARGGSKGITNKNIVPFLGKPLLSYTIQQAKDCKLIDEVYVSSDSQQILSVAEEYGAKLINRPKEISDDFATSESALIHALKDKQECLLVFLQATSPLRTPLDIEKAILKFNDSKCDSLFSAVNAGDICIWSTDKKLKSITYDYKNRKRRQDFSSYVVENGSFYITKSSNLLKNNNRLSGKISYSIMEKWKMHEIDCIEDLHLCEYFYKTKILEVK